MFFNIACFFTDFKKCTFCQVYWNGDDSLSPMLMLQNLKSKSLIKWAKDGGLYMHEQLRDMDRNITRKLQWINLYGNQIYLCKRIRFEQHV